MVDDGEGNLIGDGDGYIRYSTGKVSVKFTQPPAAGASVVATYSRKPSGILVRALDTSKETTGVVLKHGLAVKANVLVGASVAAAADLARLEPMIVAI